jgi:excisionase family DNA binding protein
VADVADHYGVSTRTVWRWIRAGHLTAYRVGARAVRVDLDDLDKLARRIPAAKSA